MEYRTSIGAVAGMNLGDVTRVSGIPYAAPALGDLRFTLPRPAVPWKDVLDFTHPSPIPPQFPSRLAMVMGDYPAEQSEDCLKLEIWVPKGDSGNRPVIVFLHGGAFMTGGGGLPCYDGEVLARHSGAIVVNVTYRLGALGFLPIPGSAPANLGLHDQIAALHFIRREIGAFGGDADNITVCGQSAGALSIAILLSLPQGKELFNRAIMMSAPLGISLRSAADVADLADIYLHALGLAAGDRAALSSLPVSEILRAQGVILKEWSARTAPDMITPPFMPVIDGDLIDGQVVDNLYNNPPSWCPVVIGYTREETAAFWFGRKDLEPFATQVLAERFEAAFPEEGSRQLAAFKARRATSASLPVLADLRTHCDFAKPNMNLAAKQVAAGGTAYAYRFDWQSPNPDIAACHCIELPFFFGNLETWKDAPMLFGASPDEIASISRMFQQSLTSFVRSGDPTAYGLPWPAHELSGAVLHFDRLANCSVSAGEL